MDRLYTYTYTEHVVFSVFFLCVTCPCSFWTKRHANLLVNNNNNNNNIHTKSCTDQNLSNLELKLLTSRRSILLQKKIRRTA